jgi:ribosome biogenesis GTPase
MCTVMTGSADVRVTSDRAVDLAVGDWVAVDGRIGAGTARIASVLPRRAAFRRTSDGGGASAKVIAANIDTVFVCDALDGSLSPRHLERFVALAWHSGATPVVVITKSDTVSPPDVAKAVDAVRTTTAEVSVVAVSSRSGDGVPALKSYLLPGRTVALLGLSGAGKSTLTNLLAGSEIMATGAVRADGAGRHTTTHRELVVLPQGGLLIDTPGMRALSVLGASEGVAQAFSDIEELVAQCRYPDCSHTGESGCAIAAAASDGHLEPERFEAWLRLTAESASQGASDTRRQIAERKRRKAAKFESRRSRNA